VRTTGQYPERVVSDPGEAEHKPEHLSGEQSQWWPAATKRPSLISLIWETLRWLGRSWGGRALLLGSALFSLAVWAVPFSRADGEDALPGAVFFVLLGMGVLLFEWWMSGYRHDEPNLRDPEDWKQGMAMVMGLVALSIGLIGMASGIAA
jgi:hypothetical protein